MMSFRKKSSVIRAVWLGMVLVAGAGCGRTDFIDHPGGRQAQVGEGDVEIYVRGDTTPRTISDGLAGQTPTELTMAMSTFQLLRSASDGSPVTVFDYRPGADVEADLLGETLVGRGKLSEIPAGTYTHGRSRLTRTRFIVAATVHAGGAHIPGTLRVVGLYPCDCNDSYEDPETGVRLTPGRAVFTFRAATFSQTVEMALPPLPQTAGGTVVQDASGTWLVYQLPQPFIVPGATHLDNSGICKATMVYDVADSFRWRDQATAGYTDDVFDVDGLAGTYEPVMNFGATGYHVEMVEERDGG